MTSSGTEYSSYDYTKNYTRHKFIGDERGIQTQELNDIQKREHLKIEKYASAIGTNFVLSGGFNNINGSGLVTLDAADVFCDGDYLRVAAGTVTIPASKAVKVGVRIVESDISSVDDTDLLNPAEDTQGFDKPGADRLKKTLAWGWIDEDATTDGGSGTLYPLMYFYNRKFLAQREDSRLPKAVINSTDFDGMVLFEDIVYDLNLSAAAADITVHVDTNAFYQGSQGIYAFMDTQGGIGAYQLTIQRDDAGIRFNGDDNELVVSTRHLQFFIRRETDVIWNIVGINYGN